ncbi:hypothetical protein [Nocardioides cynanchi]|uniref:hypothetical protein n=1 Tax=Nocardioides cynanchi TaxID=2558918 RepID=UPI001248B5EC|nr:hypothetical protein [Nocardioides cynanchi]
MSRAAAYKAAEEGRIPTVRISERRLMVTAGALDQLLYPDDYRVTLSGADAGTAATQLGVAV